MQAKKQFTFLRDQFRAGCVWVFAAIDCTVGNFTKPAPTEERTMSVAKVIEIKATSKKSFDDAIEEGVKQA